MPHIAPRCGKSPRAGARARRVLAGKPWCARAVRDYRGGVSAPVTDAQTAHAAGVERLLESYPRGSRDGDGAAGQAHLESVPLARGDHDAGSRHLWIGGRHCGRSRCAYRRRRRNVHVRRPRGRDAALRAGAARGAAAEDHHPGRRRHRARHRVDVVSQRAAARVRARDGHPHRRRRDRDRIAHENADLFRAFPNSYGTLGYAVRLRIELEPVKPFVALTHLRFHALADLVAAMDGIIETGRHDGVRGRLPRRRGLQRRRELPLPRHADRRRRVRSATTPASASTTGPSSTTTASRRDRLTIHDYLWRWDTDWFWCSEAFGAQHPIIRRFWPRRYRRSSVVLEADGTGAAVRHRRPPREAEGPASSRTRRAGHRGADRAVRRVPRLVPGNVPIEPIWLCPLRLRDEDGWPLYPIRAAPDLRQHRLLGDRAGRADRGGDEPADRAQGQRTRRPQIAVLRRLLLARRIRPNSTAARPTVPSKERYDPDSRLLDLYAKAVQRR